MEKIKILGLNLSPRDGRNTYHLMNAVLEGCKSVEGKDVETEIINAADAPEGEFKLCRGCWACVKTGKCVLGEDFISKIYDKIKEADGVIIAADKNVEMMRFDGKPVLKTPVSRGINEPEELIKAVIDGKAPVYKYEGGKTTDVEAAKESTGRQIYKHLMNGVSYMLPFVIGGGIMMALAFLIDTIAGAPRDASFGTYTAASAFFKTVGGYAFSFMLPVLAGYIARSIADRPGLAVGFVGGYIATIGCTFSQIAGDSTAVSGFLGALIAGFAGGYIVLLLRKIFSFLPKSIESMLPVLILPLLGIILIGLFMCAISGCPKPVDNRCPQLHGRDQQDNIGMYRRRNDGHRHGRAIQQSGLCVWYRSYHDRWV